MVLLLSIFLILFSFSCSKEETTEVDVDPAETVQISEEGIKFVGQSTDGALVTIQMYDNILSLVLDNRDMYPDGTLSDIDARCFNIVRFGITINGTKINGKSIDISCPVANTPPTDDEKLDFSFTTDTLPAPDFETERFCNDAGLRYDALKDLTDLPVLNNSIRYCIGSDNKTYKVVINKLAGIGLEFPTRFNFLNRTVSGVISVIDTDNNALNLILGVE